MHILSHWIFPQPWRKWQMPWCRKLSNNPKTCSEPQLKIPLPQDLVNRIFFKWNLKKNIISFPHVWCRCLHFVLVSFIRRKRVFIMENQVTAIIIAALLPHSSCYPRQLQYFPTEIIPGQSNSFTLSWKRSIPPASRCQWCIQTVSSRGKGLLVPNQSLSTLPTFHVQISVQRNRWVLNWKGAVYFLDVPIKQRHK